MEIQAKRDWGSSDRPDLVHACLTLFAYIVLKNLCIFWIFLNILSFIFWRKSTQIVKFTAVFMF